jgi:hypothetical protein
MTLNQLASLGPSALKTREGFSFLLGYAKHEHIGTFEHAVLQVQLDCINLCDPHCDIDVLCELAPIADVDFS